MALPEIIPQDFTGIFRISQVQLLKDDLNSFIDEYYEDFVREIIGDSAYIEVRDESPLTKQKWLDLFNGADYFNKDSEKNQTHKGLRRVALGVIYFYWLKDDGVINTPTGNQRNKNSNSNRVNGGIMARDRYNRVIRQMQENIYPFVKNYSETKGLIDSSIDLGGNNYTINVSDTTYLYDGDTVRIDNIDYVVSNVVNNTSFDIVASSTGLSFGGESFEYEPFKDFPLPCIYASVL